MDLSLSNIINISVSQSQTGIGSFNNSALALFTRETAAESFGDLGYKIYLSPQEVATDFGTSSVTYKMANAVFSQQPNILANNGYLVIVPYLDNSNVTAVQRISFSLAPAAGSYKLNYDGDVTGSIAYNADAATIQTAVRTLTGLGSATVVGTAATQIDVTFTGVTGAAALLTVTDNSLQTATPVNVVITVTTTTAGSTASTETLDEAIVRTEDLVYYFGIMTAEITTEADMLDAAAVVQALNKIVFFVSRDDADVEPDGMLDMLQQGGFTHSRGLYYGGATDLLALIMEASYAGRGLSVNFTGSNTTVTMHMKDLSGVTADPSMDQTLLGLCEDAGVDVYASFEGVAKVFCTGANRFFDQVYNEGWIVGAFQVAGFNYLAQSATKVPQTESGMDGLKGAYRKVCQQGVSNAYLAPGEWNSSTTFGNLSDFLANIAQVGYYIYSSPISQQAQADREDRIAPLIQIALKEAGAVQKSNVIININA
jgi:hypothetical protein